MILKQRLEGPLTGGFEETGDTGFKNYCLLTTDAVQELREAHSEALALLEEARGKLPHDSVHLRDDAAHAFACLRCRLDRALGDG